MKPIRCIFGRHAYKPSNEEVYLCGKENGRLKYRAINHCIYCGKKVEVLFDMKKPVKFAVEPEREYTMEEFMYGQDMGNPEDGSL